MTVNAQATPNMSVQVYAGMILVPGTLGSVTGWFVNNTAQTSYGLPSDFTSQGAYCFYNDGTVTLDIATADPSNPRIDIICASVEDAQYQGPNNQPVLQVVTGTPAATPSAPSAPATSVVLAQISVPAGATSITSGDITDERPTPVSMVQPPYGVFYNPSSGVTIPTATAQQVLLATSISGNGMGGASNNMVVPIAGIYACSWNVGLYAPTAGGHLYSMLYHNGSFVYRGQDVEIAGASTYNVTSAGAALLECSPNDTIGLWLEQTTGATQTITNSLGSAYLSVNYVGPA